MALYTPNPLRTEPPCRNWVHFIRAFFALTICLSACCPDPSIEYHDCPAFPEAFDQYLTYSEGQALRFRNQFGDTLNFRLDSLVKSETYQCEVDHCDGLSSCPCYAFASFFFAAENKAVRLEAAVSGQGDQLHFDSLARPVLSFTLYKPEWTNEQIVEYVHGIVLEPLELRSLDEQIPTLEVGGVQYTNVIATQLDTTQRAAFGELEIWKMHFTPGIGLIQFFDKADGSVWSLLP